MNDLTYVYCLVRSGRRPALPSRITMIGIPGGRETRAVKAGDALWLIVATVPSGEYDEAALARGLQSLDWIGPRAMAHEAVVEQFLRSRAVLPMQMFTLFISDERALHHVEQQRREITRIMDRLERKVEWGLRLTFDERGAREQVEAHQPKKIKSGVDYLARKRDLLDVNRVQFREARSEADSLFAAMKREAAEARRRTETEQAAPGSRLLLDAAFLVPASRTRAFRAALRQQAKRLTAAGVAVSLTGPWPPYNFIAPPSPSAAARQPRGKKTR